MDNPAMDEDIEAQSCDKSIKPPLIPEQESLTDNCTNIGDSDSEINILSSNDDPHSWRVNKNLEATFGNDVQLSPDLEKVQLINTDSETFLASQTSDKLLTSNLSKFSEPIESDNDSNDAILDRVLNSNEEKLDNGNVEVKKRIANLIENDGEKPTLDIKSNEFGKNLDLENSKQRNNISLLDSDDSENGKANIHQTLDQKGRTENTELKKKPIKSRLKVLIDSDSSEEESSQCDNDNSNSNKTLEQKGNTENTELKKAQSKSRFKNFIDSESSDEEPSQCNNEDPNNKEASDPKNNTENIELMKKQSKSRLKTLIDSDSSEEESSWCNNENLNNKEPLDHIDNTENIQLKKKQRKSRLKTVVNIDSSDEEPSESSKSINQKVESDIQRGRRISDTETSTNMPVEAPVYVTNDKGELIMENPVQNTFQSRISALCDPDSDDDYPIENTDYQNINIDEKKYQTSGWLQKGKTSGKKGKKTKTDPKAERTFKMTPRDAAKQREEIAAESQRMAREKDVSLPYHKPKSHTLQEFLTRRSKLASVVPIKNRGNTSIATAVKMSKEQLEVFQKRLEEREKELKEFYKSDSEESGVDDPNDTEYIPPSLEVDNQKKSTQDVLNELDEKDIIKETPNQSELCEITATENSPNIAENEIDSDLSKEKQDSSDMKKVEDLNVDPMDICTDGNVEKINENDKETEEFSLRLEARETDNINTEVINDQANAENVGESEEFSLRLEEPEVDSILNKNNDLLNKSDQTDLKEHRENSSTKKVSDIPQQNTMSYDFSLDDIEDNSDLSKSNNEMSIDEPEKDTAKVKEDFSKKNEMKKEFEYGELDMEIENFGNENANSTKPKSKIVIQSDFTIVPKPVDDEFDLELDMVPKKSKLQLLKEKFAKTTPKLSGDPDQLIDLDAGKENSEAMTRFKENFVRNATVRKHYAKHKVALSSTSLSSAVDTPKSANIRPDIQFDDLIEFPNSLKDNTMQTCILRVESGGDIHQETVAINVDDDDETAVSKIEEKPGVKLQRLRKELRGQMEREKLERWEKKASEGMRPATTESSEKDGYEDNLPDEYDDEEEEILTDEDEELEEDDVEMAEKPIKTNAFLDEEAEESETEEVEELENPTENKHGDEPDDTKPTTDDETSNMSNASNMTAESGSNVDDSDSKPASEDELPDLSLAGKNRPMKRIVKAFDDSDSEGENGDNDSSVLETTLVGANQDDNGFGKNNQDPVKKSQDEDDEILAYQPRQNNHTPIRQITQPKTMEFNTPLSFITGLENLRSATKSVMGSPAPVVSPFQMTQDSPLKAACISQKKLFSESDADSQDSSQVQETQSEPTQLNHETKENPVEDTQPTDSLNLAQTMRKEDAPCTQDILNICSGAFTGVTQFDLTERSALEKSLVLDMQHQTQEVKTLGVDQDLIISQLLDEEELENFKKRFESPVNKPATQSLTQFTQKREEAKEISGGGVLDSDEEDGEGSEKQMKVKKIRNRKIAFSDDESSSDDDEPDQNEEEIDLADNEDLEDEENVELDNIGYDSDENEIELGENGQPKKKEKLKIKDFMEDEAELSESEWGSEDEDEKDLDKLEFEVGDTEKFDEDQMKEDLDKIHMRRLLDDDARDVKLLQELLLEDGEMHGTGRQRQFRWKNIDELGDDDDSKRDEEDIYLDEEESEEQWRKRRHEREMFLKEKASQSQDGEDSNQDVLLGKSKLLSISQKILQRSRSLNSQTSNSATTETPAEKVESPLLHKFTLLNKRGSFLSRGEQALQRVAAFTTNTTININGSKTTKNFVFQTLSATTEIAALQNKKRKAQDGTPDVLKKLRLSNTFSPAAAGVKKQKTERAKKLF